MFFMDMCFLMFFTHNAYSKRTQFISEKLAQLKEDRFGSCPIEDEFDDCSMEEKSFGENLSPTSSGAPPLIRIHGSNTDEVRMNACEERAREGEREREREREREKRGREGVTRQCDEMFGVPLCDNIVGNVPTKLM